MGISTTGPALAHVSAIRTVWVAGRSTPRLRVYHMFMALSRSFDLSVRRFGRRRFVTGTLGCGAALACVPQIFGAEFWNSKDPSAWTEQEIQVLMTKSPWTREAVANFKNADDPTADPSGGLGGGRGASRRAAFDPIYVRWESAQPVLDALRAPLPAEFAGLYVISVTNLPIRIAPSGGRGGTPPGAASRPRPVTR